MSEENGRDRAHATVNKVTIRVLSAPKDGSPIAVIFLGPIHGTLTHYTAEGSVACRGTECPRNLHQKKVIWKGYAAVQVHNKNDRGRYFPAILEVTEKLSELIHSEDPRGQCWVIRRLDLGNDKSEVTALFDSKRHEEGLPREFDVKAAMQRFFRCTDLFWDHAPIIPPPVMAEEWISKPPAVADFENKRVKSRKTDTPMTPADERAWEEFKRRGYK
jgi:hypothetical protein